MTWWHIEPRDPLLVRDARPFSAEASTARSMDFPTPSVTAGVMRSRIGFALRRPDAASFALSPADARKIRVTGPLLTEAVDGALRVLLPPPRDAILFERPTENGHWPVYAHSPAAQTTDPDLSSLRADLRPVVPSMPLPRDKPARDAPAFWSQSLLQRWLSGDVPTRHISPDDTSPSLLHEGRVHVKLDPETNTAEDGKLFSTDGLRFTLPRADKGWSAMRQPRLLHDEHREDEPLPWNKGWSARSGMRQRRLLIRCTHAALVPGHQTMGGERRLSTLEPAPLESLSWPAPTLGAARARVMLLTPAWFHTGAIPEQIGGARVVAAAVGRPLIISGWDLASPGAKPTRRLAPSGSIYWVELGDIPPSEWCRRVHLKEISEGEQNCRDGFGLAAVGVWL